MPILVDYRCDACGTTAETFVSTPVPQVRECGACGALAKRRFSPVGIMSAAPEPRPRVSAREPSLCATNPDVPGLCHMSPSAARVWVARARGDHRAVDAELARQERAAADSPPKLSDAITHAHAPSGTSTGDSHDGAHVSSVVGKRREH